MCLELQRFNEERLRQLFPFPLLVDALSLELPPNVKALILNLTTGIYVESAEKGVAQFEIEKVRFMGYRDRFDQPCCLLHSPPHFFLKRRKTNKPPQHPDTALSHRFAAFDLLVSGLLTEVCQQSRAHGSPPWSRSAIVGY